VHDYWDLAKAENKNALLRTLGWRGEFIIEFCRYGVQILHFFH